MPLTVHEQSSLTECAAELSTAAYAGMLMEQAMGLGGWMFSGIDRLTMLGASGDLMYLQAHHLDLEYYDQLFLPGAYLQRHAEHLERWHGIKE